MKKKVCLISQQGSGTNIFRQIINREKDIMIFGEIFVKRKGFEYENVKSWAEYVLGKSNKEIVGFDLKYNQINKEILDYLLVENYGIIHLYRDEKRTYWRGKKLGYRNCKASLTEFVRHIKYVKEKREEINRYFKGKIKIFYYEDMTRGKKIKEFPKDFKNKLLKWIKKD